MLPFFGAALTDSLRQNRESTISECPAGVIQPSLMRLGAARRGFRGVIQELCAARVESALSATELESRLIELGFVEGARVEILHEGIIGRDPIAVRVDDVTIAVRRREAMAIIVT